MKRVRIFVIFDTEHDADLYALLRTQSNGPGCAFSVLGGSVATSHTDAWQARARSLIREADQVLVICGEHTEESPYIHSELLIAIAEKKPYLLLWGRRSVMCTKPIGVTRTEGMYSWTEQNLHDQISLNLRQSSTETRARSLRKASGQGQARPSPAATQEEVDADPAVTHTVR